MIQGIYFNQDIKQFSLIESDENKTYSNKDKKALTRVSDKVIEVGDNLEIVKLKHRLRKLEAERLDALTKFNKGRNKVDPKKTLGALGIIAGGTAGALITKKAKGTGVGALLGGLAGKSVGKKLRTSNRTSDDYLRLKTIDSEIDAIKKRLKQLEA